MEVIHFVLIGWFIVVCLISLFLILNRNYRRRGQAQNYEKIREKLTIREEEPEQKEEEREDEGDDYSPSINPFRIVSKIVGLLLTLYVGSEVMNEFGKVITQSNETACSPFYNGFSLIGWKVVEGCVTETSGTGLIAVIMIIGVASIAIDIYRMVW